MQAILKSRHLSDNLDKYYDDNLYKQIFLIILVEY